MGLKILVYNNQEGYFSFLKKNINGGNNSLLHYNDKIKTDDINMLIFFMSDSIELADYVKLYRSNIPVVFGYTGPYLEEYKNEENLYYVNLSAPKDTLLRYINAVISKI